MSEDTDRKLASVQKIENIRPHPNADKLELADVLGWQVVVGKGLYSNGDTVVYCEIDSVLPDEPEFEFMRPRNFRVKTIRLRGELGQGLCIPLNEYFNVASKHATPDENGNFDVTKVQVGDDITEKMKVRKYALPEHDQNRANLHAANGLEPFPGFLKKTDSMRIQSYPRLLEEIQGMKLYVTEKEDGTSFTAFLHENEFGICTRKLRVKLEKEDNLPGEQKRISAYEQIAIELDLEKRMRNLENLASTLEQKELAKSFCIQGELIGTGIQGNKRKLTGLGLRVFDVYDIKAGRYLDFNDMLLVVYALELQFVNVVASNVVIDKTMKEWIEFAKGNYEGTSSPREGLVVRPMEGCYSQVLRTRLAFKVINNDFLLKEKD